MTLFDVDKDGQISAREWEAAHLAAKAQVRRAEIKEPPTDAIHIVAKPDDRTHPYIISTQKQASLVPRWKRYSFACFTAFLAGGSLFIYAWIVRPPLQIFFG